ncbi:MAG: carboxypeptidase regulatory-like domain-containing protein [Chloroflexi bacterium]|nr:carboxypeptidase regulatory-like domain-containing protein [Chloroflexota bacterium]
MRGALLKRAVLSFVSALVIAACTTPSPTLTPVPPTATPYPTYTPYPTLTPLPTPTPTLTPTPTPTSTPTPTLTPTLTPTPTITPTPTPVPVAAKLSYTTKRERAGLDWFGSVNVPLSTVRPTSIKKEPAYSCSFPLYGIMTIGTLKIVSVSYCADSPNVGTAYFDLNGNGDLTDDSSYTFGKGSLLPVETTLKYHEGKRPYAFTFWANVEMRFPPTPTPSTPTPGVPTPTPTPYGYGGTPVGGNLYYSSHGIRVGFLTGLEQPVAVALIDANNDGLFNDLANDRLAIDLDGDGFADGSTQSFSRSLEHFTMDTSIYIQGTPLKVGFVSASGDELRLEKAQTGTLTGLVLGADTGGPLAGAKVTVLPWKLEATTDATGKYILEVAEGLVPRLRVSSGGYVPKVATQLGAVKAGATLISNHILSPTSKVTAGTLTLPLYQGYSFATGTMMAWGEGDFQLTRGDPWVLLFYTESSRGQGGIVALGDLGATPLASVSTPSSGYQFYTVPVSVNSVYVAKAREGQEGHYIILRVIEMGERDVTFDWLYK